MSRLLALAALALCSCAREGALSGSVGELFSLEVSAVEVRRNEEALQLTYLQNRGRELDVVIRLTVALRGLELVPGQKQPLEGEYEPGHARTTVVHAPGGEPARLFPRVSRGDLLISSGGGVGEATSGDFSLAFQSAGGDLGAGRTLAGTFSAIALDGGF